MSTYEPIASQILSSSAATVTFSSLPQNYTDLILVINGGITAANWSIRARFNGDSTSLYSQTGIAGNGSSVATDRSSNASSIAIVGGLNGLPINTLNNVGIIQIQNYSNSATFKTILTRTASPSQTVEALVGLYRSTNPITQIELFSGSGNLFAGSTFTIYGVSAGNSSAKASGGNIVTTDGSYWYHAFTSSGTFIPNEALTADVLCIAGGGGGGGGVGGGGGAGGYQLFTSQSLTTAVQTVTVGAGGVGGSGAGAAGITSGSNSRFGSLTASVGGGYGGSINAQIVGVNGGSGGGGAGSYAAGTATSGQGNNGATGGNAGGGGGGAGSAGTSASSLNGGAGGAGSNSVSSWASATGTGVSGFYAGGGGGGGNSGGSGGAAGSGGATAGTVSSNASNAAANTGSGAGGGAYSGSAFNGGNGGSGIIIIRYAV